MAYQKENNVIAHRQYKTKLNLKSLNYY